MNANRIDLDGFNDEVVKMQNVDGILGNVARYLGTVDAAKEWNDNAKEAHKKFLHTKSYCDFEKEDSLILLGRTGTGKTAILRCLSENVNNRRITTYDCAVTVPFDMILDNLINTVDDFSVSTINYNLVKSITIFINCFVMKTLVKKNLADRSSKIYKYINDNKLYDIGDIEYLRGGINKIKNMIYAAKKLKNKPGEVASDIITVIDIIEAFLQNGYEEAYAEMVKILKSFKVLVLIDTLDEYDLRDIKIVLCMKALIATCFEFYNISSQNHVYVKISIPSEIHTHLIEKLPGKQQGNTVVIQWNNNDLVKMIAIRLLSFSKTKEGREFNFENSYKYEDFYGDNTKSSDCAEQLIHEFLPKDCSTSLNFSFDTIAYCIRHTLKKPRELMSIFNCLISKIIENHDMKYFMNHDYEISDMIHSTQEELITAALSMYSTSYPNILRSCEIVLHDLNYYFKGKELEDRLKEAVAIYQGYDKEDIKRILLESGLVGKINKISYISKNNSPSENITHNQNKCVRIVKAKFEYQVKGRLSLNRDSYYVLHPMCYEHFECTLGSQTLVYPDEFRNDAEWLKSVKLKEWQ